MIDIVSIEAVLTAAVWITPLIIGLVQVLKISLALPTRWTPLASVCFGIGMGLLVVGFNGVGVFSGIIFGLGASGLYDFGKKTIVG